MATIKQMGNWVRLNKEKTAAVYTDSLKKVTEKNLKDAVKNAGYTVTSFKWES